MRLDESLNYLDMEDKVSPVLSIDEFKSTIGEDKDIIVLTFITSAKPVAEDLVNWLERGYDFILDAETSPGEVLDKKYYVFAEFNRRKSAPFRIIEIISDLKTLTNLSVEDWEVKISGKKYPLTKEIIEKLVPLSPTDYSRIHDEELNEMRKIAGLKPSSTYDSSDEELKAMQRQAGVL